MTGRVDAPPAWDRTDAAPDAPRGDHGYPRGPMLYRRTLRRVVDLLDALDAFAVPDPAEQEGPHRVTSPIGRAALTIYDEDAADDDSPNAGIIGWVAEIDANVWVFAPRWGYGDRGEFERGEAAWLVLTTAYEDTSRDDEWETEPGIRLALDVLGLTPGQGRVAAQVRSEGRAASPTPGVEDGR